MMPGQPSGSLIVRTRYYLSLLATALILVAVAGTESASQPSTSATGGQLRLRLALANTLTWPQIGIAQSLGLWEKHGVKLEFTQFQSGQDVLQSLLAGQIDVGTAADSVFVFAATARQPVRAFLVAQRILKAEIVYRADSGITKPSDLIGKRVGITFGTTSHLQLGDFLQQNGLPLKGVEAVNMGPQDWIPSLRQGGVQAISPWEPFAFHAKNALGSGVSAFAFPVSQSMLLITTETIAQNNPEILRRFTAVMRDADKLFVSDPNQAVALIAGIGTFKSGIDQEAVKATWANRENRVAVPGELLARNLSRFAGIAIGFGLIKGPAPDFTTYFANPTK